MPRARLSSRYSQALARQHEIERLRREPYLKRPLPDAYLEARQNAQASGSSVKYTDAEVRGIVKYVSHRPTVDPRAPLGLDFQELNNRITESEEYGKRVAEERQKTLLERVEKPPLISRLDVPAHASDVRPVPLAAPHPVPWVDFKKQGPLDRRNIFLPRLQAFLLRLEPVDDIITQRKCDYTEDADKVLVFIQLLQGYAYRVEENPRSLDDDDWKNLNYFTAASKLIRLKNLRANFGRVLKDILALQHDYPLTWAEEAPSSS